MDLKIGIIGNLHDGFDKEKAQIEILKALLKLRLEIKRPFTIVSNGLTCGIGGLASHIADLCGDGKMSVFCLMAPISLKFRDMNISQLARASQEDADALFIELCDVIILVGNEAHATSVAEAAKAAGKQVIEIDLPA